MVPEADTTANPRWPTHGEAPADSRHYVNKLGGVGVVRCAYICIAPREGPRCFVNHACGNPDILFETFADPSTHFLDQPFGAPHGGCGGRGPDAEGMGGNADGLVSGFMQYVVHVPLAQKFAITEREKGASSGGVHK